MKILLVTEPSGGGSGRHVADLAGALSDGGHQVALVYSPVRAEQHFLTEVAALNLFALEALPMSRAVGPGDLSSALALRKLIQRLGPFDVVHAHSSKAGALLRLVAPSGAARVYTPHAFRTMDPEIGLASRLVYGGVETVLAHFWTDGLIAVAPEEARHAAELGVPARKIHTVVNGLSPLPPRDRKKIRAELGIAPDDIAIGFVGRLSAQKDPVRFARAVRIAHQSSARIRGVVLGDGDLADEVRTAGGEALTLLSGRVARPLLPGFDLFAMTSRYEAMPYVLIEALQAGLPILSTAVGGASIAVKDGGNGALLPVGASPETVAQAMTALAAGPLDALSALSRRMGQAYTVKAMTEDTLTVYDDALRLRRGA